MNHKIEHFKDLDTAQLKEHDTIEITKSFYEGVDACIWDVVGTNELTPESFGAIKDDSE